MIIAFDLDDTLYKECDFVASGRRALSAAFPEADIDGVWTPQMLSIYRNHIPDITLDPAVADVLGSLMDGGHTLALVTDGRSITQRNKIEALSLGRFFPQADILISEETGCCKETGSPFEMLMHAHPDEHRCVYVGDNPAKDFSAPKRLGWYTVMLRDTDASNIHTQDATPQTPAHAVIDSLADLPALVRNLANPSSEVFVDQIAK